MEFRSTANGAGRANEYDSAESRYHNWVSAIEVIEGEPLGLVTQGPRLP